MGYGSWDEMRRLGWWDGGGDMRVGWGNTNRVEDNDVHAMGGGGNGPVGERHARGWAGVWLGGGGMHQIRSNHSACTSRWRRKLARRCALSAASFATYAGHAWLK